MLCTNLIEIKVLKMNVIKYKIKIDASNTIEISSYILLKSIQKKESTK